MPDSSHPGSWGHQPFDERDLDALLDGNAADVPPALRPVADAIDALLAAPSAAESQGESAIRAHFRAQRQPGGPETSPAVPVQVPGTPSVPFPLPAEPVKLQSVPADTARSRRGRHSRRGLARSGLSRPASKRRGRSRGRLVAAATGGAALIVLVTATYSGALPGPVQNLAHKTIAAPAGRTSAGQAPKPGMDAPSASAVPSTGTTAAPVPRGTIPVPTASPSVTPNQVALCNAFLPVAEHPAPGQVSWQSTAYSRLVAAAGGERQVYGYCEPVWSRQFPGGYPKFPAYPPYFPKPGKGYPGNGAAPGNGSTGAQPGGWPTPSSQAPTQSAQPGPYIGKNTSSPTATPTSSPDAAPGNQGYLGHPGRPASCSQTAS